MRKLCILKFYIKSNRVMKTLIIYKILNRLGFKNTIVKNYSKNAGALTMESIVDISMHDVSEIDLVTLSYLCKMYKQHRFNILGSGWVSAAYDSEPLGLEGIKFRAEGKTRPIVMNSEQKTDDAYSPIDWHKDLKTGYLFDALKYPSEIYKDIPRGVDVKIPWELSRMYHLTQMAIFALINAKERNAMIREFKNQIIDFNNSNFIGRGVNYSCPMEVAIRATNILVAFDIFKQLDNDNILNDTFEKMLLQSLLTHGRVIAYNLELDIYNDNNGNHYLSDLCGLIFISAYIKNEETKKWFKFGKDEFIKEINKQFLSDGGSFECSTAYHRLAAEIVVNTIAVLIHENVNIDKQLISKINNIIKFSLLTIKHDGTIIQIGDNDSGRLFKLLPKGKFIDAAEVGNYNFNLSEYFSVYGDSCIFIENELLTDSVIANAYAIIQNSRFKAVAERCKFEYSFIKSIVGNYRSDLLENNVTVMESLIYYDIDLDDFKFKTTNRILLDRVKLKNVNLKFAPEFGLYLFYDDNFQLFIRGIPDFDKMRKGHCHDDVLHYELVVDDVDYFFDNGSYIYTPLPDKRNVYRCSSAHNVPQYDLNAIDFLDIFKTLTHVSGNIVIQNNRQLGILIELKNYRHYRHFKICENEIVITDYSNNRFVSEIKQSVVRSNGYGILGHHSNSTNGISVLCEEENDDFTKKTI